MNSNPHRWSSNGNSNGNGRSNDRPPRQEAYVRPAPKPLEDDKETITREEWEPSDEQFARFLKRDMQQAMFNVEIALRSKGLPMAFRDLKEALLHSAETIERVLTSKIADGSIKEERGRFLLVK